MRTKTLKELILTTLRRNRYSMTANQIIYAIEQEQDTITEGSLSVMLTRFKNEGLLKTERLHCHCCGHVTCHYTLTELGFIKSRDYEPLLGTVGQYLNLEEVA